MYVKTWTDNAGALSGKTQVPSPVLVRESVREELDRQRK
jgi:hypothetical protein